ncbi:MAG: hypothetical protein IT434_10150 [Phycisphaerales bacterium]|nr:hypothetical protein [Phycisphaerales bacterium]
MTRHSPSPKPLETRSVDDLFVQCYDTLRAHGRLALAIYRGHSIQGTELVHEIFAKLRGRSFSDERHFCALAFRAMKQHLVNRLERKRAKKRGGDWARTDLPVDALLDDLADPALAEGEAQLSESIEWLCQFDSIGGEVLILRTFGLSKAEIATALSLPPERVDTLLTNSLAAVKARMQEEKCRKKYDA